MTCCLRFYFPFNSYATPILSFFQFTTKFVAKGLLLFLCYVLFQGAGGFLDSML